MIHRLQSQLYITLPRLPCSLHDIGDP